MVFPGLLARHFYENKSLEHAKVKPEIGNLINSILNEPSDRQIF